jgi:hypothetical protein
MILSNEPPQKTDYIVCVTGGITDNILPTEDGWRRIYTSIRLKWGTETVFTNLREVAALLSYKFRGKI